MKDKWFFKLERRLGRGREKIVNIFADDLFTPVEGIFNEENMFFSGWVENKT